MIEIKNLKKQYKTRDSVINAVNDISLTFPDKGMFFILGKSGSGKTTLINVISGIDNFESGDIVVNNIPLKNMNGRQSDDFRNTEIGIVFQEYNLIETLNVYNNISIVFEIQDGNKNAADTQKAISDILDYVGLSGYENRKISEMSGGERQRLAIARALVKKPKIIFADEPTGNLDTETGKKVFDLFQKISKEILVIVISHDAQSAYKYGDKIITISDGRVKSIDQVLDRNETYSLTISEISNERKTLLYSSDKMSKNEVQDYLNDFIKSDNFSLKYDIVISKNTYPKSSEKNYDESMVEKDSNIETEHAVVRSMRFCFLLKLALSFMRKNKLKLFFTIIMLTISIFLLTLSSFFVFYDKTDVIENYLNVYKPSFLISEQTLKYTDNLFKEHSYTLSSGKKIEKELYESLQKNNIMGMTFSNNVFYNDTDYLNDITMLFCDDIKVTYNIEGQIPLKGDEIAITDYLSLKMDLSIGNMVVIDNNEYIITGIIKTDYIEYDLIRKLHLSNNSDYLYYYLKYKYNVVLLSETAIESQICPNSDTICISISNFLLCNRESQYTESDLANVRYAALSDDLSLDDLSIGRLPQNKNEILISQEFAYKNNLVDEDYNFIIGGSYQFKNIYDNKYNGCFDNILNMSEYFDSDITVVGVLNENYNSDDFSADVIISADTFNLIRESYYNNYYYNAYMICINNNNYSEIAEKIDKANLMFNEPSIMKIYEFDNAVTSMKMIIIILFIIIFILSMVIIINYITVSVRENNKNIGILKSLGIRGHNISILFFMQSAIIYILGLILSIVLSDVIIQIINNMYMERLTDYKFAILLWNNIVFVMVIIVTFIACLLSSVFPIYKLLKRKPVEIIGDNF